MLAISNLELVILRDPLIVSSDTLVLAAIEQMSGCQDPLLSLNSSSCAVVMEAGKVLGVLTEHDVVRLVAQQQPIAQLTLREVLPQPPVTLPESALQDLATTIPWLAQQQITHLPIVNEQQQLTGLVTADGLRQVFIAHAQQAQANPPHLGNHDRNIVALQRNEHEQRLSSLMGNLPGFVYQELNDPDFTPIYISPSVVSITGYEPHEYLVDRTISCGQLIVPEDVDFVWQTVQAALAARQPFECEYRITDKWGQQKWLWERGSGIYNQAGELAYLEGFITDISDRKRTESRLESQNAILEQVAKAAPLQEVLTNLLSDIETDIPGSACSIMLCRDDCLCDTVAPSLPPEYVAAIAQALIGEGVGSCGTAVYRREVVIVSDIEQDPLWQNYKQIPLAYGLRASWSIPIFASDQTLLGVFGIYYRESKAPSSQDIAAVEKAANLAGIAIERAQAAQALQQLNQELESRIQARTQELQEREQFLQTVLDTFPLSVFWKDRHSVYLGCNQQFLRDANRTSVADVIGKTDDEMPWGRTEAELYRQDDRTVITTETAKLSIIESQYQADGQKIWLETNKLPLRNLQGEVIGVLGTYQDITDRKTTELALIASQTQFRRMTENVPGMIYQYILHADGTDELTYVSSRVRELFEVEPEDALFDSSQVWSKIHPDDAPWLREEIQACADALRPFVSEYRLLLPQQGLRWVNNLSHVSKLDNGDVVWDGVVLDCTASKQAEQKLNVLSERLELALDGAQIGVWESTPDGRLIWDERMLALYGVEAADFSGHYKDWLQRLHPDDHDRIVQLAAQALRERERTSTEFRIVRPDGTVRFIDSHVFNQRNEQGEVVKTIGVNRDITDRKIAEIELQNSQSRFRRLTENVPGMIYQFVRQADGQESFTYISPQIIEIYEVAAELVMQDPAYLWERIHPDDRPTLQVKGLESAQNLSQFAFEHRLVTPSGPKFAKAISMPYRQDNGAVIWDGIVIDMTDRKLVELALEESRNQFRRTIENIPGMIYRYFLYPDGRQGFSYISPQVREIYEVEADQVLQNPELLWARIHPDDVLAHAANLLESSTNLTPAVFEHRLITPSGPKFAKATSRPYRQDDGAIVWDGVVVDITDLKTAKIALEKEILHRSTIFNTSPDGIHILDQDGNLIEANASFAQMLGYCLEEMTHLNVTDWDAQWSIAELREMFQSFPDCIEPTFETLHRRKDKSVFPVEITQCRMEWNREWVLVCLSRDISERKQAELQLQQTNEQLARATRLKDEFLANMSHELRTPLNAILGTTEALQDQVFGGVNDRQLKALRTIEKSSNHLLALINDILDVAKIEAGQIELNYAATNITTLCHASLAFIKQQAVNKHIQLDLNIPSHLPDINIDERRIRQVLINLLNNAVKFTPDGGQVTLQVHYIDRQTTPSDCRADSFCERNNKL